MKKYISGDWSASDFDELINFKKEDSWIAWLLKFVFVCINNFFVSWTIKVWFSK